MLVSVGATTMTLQRSLPPLLLATLLAGADGALAAAASSRDLTTAAAAAPQIDYAFDHTNPLAVAWAETHSAKLVTQVTEETRQAIRDAIARSFREGISAKDTARQLERMVGLTAPQAEALMNLRDRLLNANPGTLLNVGNSPVRVPAGGLSPERIDSVLDKYGDRLLRQRAEMIARTETIAAANEGQRLLWLQAVDDGLLTGKEGRIWIVTPDDKLCPECEAIGAESEANPVGLDEPFETDDDAVMGPPAHPNCRCAVGLVPAERMTGREQPPSREPALPLGEDRAPAEDRLPAEEDVTVEEDVTDETIPAEEPGTSFELTPSDAPLPPAEKGYTIEKDTEYLSQARINELLATDTLTADDMAAGFLPKLENDTWRVTVGSLNEDLYGKVAERAVKISAFSDDGIELVRILERMEDGRLRAIHDYFELPDHMQGSGFAKQVLAHQFEWYKTIGVSEVKIGANIDVGGYAWARFGFAPYGHSLEEIVSDVNWRANELRLNGDIDATMAARITRLTEALKAGDGTAIWEIADLRQAVEPIYKQFKGGKFYELGKALLLGSSWNGKISMSDLKALARLEHYL